MTRRVGLPRFGFSSNGVALQPPPEGVDAPAAAGEVAVLSAERPLTVLIVDDAVATRRFLRTVLEHSPDFEVVGEANDGQEAIAQAEYLQPDLLLLDLTMPIVSGAGALNLILEVSPRTLVIIVSGSHPQAVEPLIDAGAAAFVPKGIAPFELLRRLGTIAGRSVRLDGAGGWDEFERRSTRAALPAPVPAEFGGRAVVYDPDPLVRTLIARVLGSSDIEVVAETNTAPIYFMAVELARPEIVVLDLPPGPMLDTTVLSETNRISPDSTVIVYSTSAQWKDQALAAGATAFVPKPRIDELAHKVTRLTPRNRQ